MIPQLENVVKLVRFGLERCKCEESCSIIPFDTSLTCCIALCTVVQYSVCPQSSSLSTDHVRKHIDITHASAWLKDTLKRDILSYTCAFDIIKCLSW